MARCAAASGRFRPKGPTPQPRLHKAWHGAFSEPFCMYINGKRLSSSQALSASALVSWKQTTNMRIKVQFGRYEIAPLHGHRIHSMRSASRTYFVVS